MGGRTGRVSWVAVGLDRAWLGTESQVGGVTAEGPDAGVRVTDAEEGVALTLDEMLVGDTGPVVPGGVKQRPPPGVTTEVERGGRSGNRLNDVARRGGRRTRNSVVPTALHSEYGDPLPLEHTALAAGAHARPLGPQQPTDDIHDDDGTDLARGAQVHDLTSGLVDEPVPGASSQDLGDEIDAGGATEGDVEEPGPGDDDVPHTVTGGEPGAQDLGHVEGGLPGGPGELEGDVGGVVATATGAGSGDLDALRHGDVQHPVVDSTTHRAQHGTGELDGGHGSSVWEEGGGYATGFVRAAGCDPAPHGRPPRACWPALNPDPGSQPPTDAALPLQQPPHDTHEFGGLEGLGQKGVDADVEPALDLVLRTAADDREGKITRTAVGTELRGGAQPVETGHDDIEGDHIGPHLMNHIKTLGTIGRGHDLDALQLEIDPDQLPDDLVVVHNKHPAGRAWHNSRVGPDRPPRPGFPDFHPPRVTHPSSHGVPHPAKPVHEHPTGAGSVLPVAASNATDTPP